MPEPTVSPPPDGGDTLSDLGIGERARKRSRWLSFLVPVLAAFSAFVVAP